MEVAEITIKNNLFILHPLKAVYWTDMDALLIADVHFGKVTHFRKSGIPVPREKMNENIHKLELLMDEFNPGKVFFLGDLFHSDYNREALHISQLVGNYSETDFTLITGNHDHQGFIRAIESNMEVVDYIQFEGFYLKHQPEDYSGEDFLISGHLHPSVKLRNQSKQYLKLPCFYATDEMLILPSFGSFTGAKVIKPKKGEEIFVVAGDRVIQV